MNFKEGEIIAIDKPYRMSSFGALAHIRFLCSKKQGKKVKMGHAGTLDPLATGVLVLCTGKKTKSIEEFQSHTKVCWSVRKGRRVLDERLRSAIPSEAFFSFVLPGALQIHPDQKEPPQH